MEALFFASKDPAVEGPGDVEIVNVSVKLHRSDCAYVRLRACGQSDLMVRRIAAKQPFPLLLQIKAVAAIFQTIGDDMEALIIKRYAENR